MPREKCRIGKEQSIATTEKTPTTKTEKSTSRNSNQNNNSYLTDGKAYNATQLTET